jgi:hypothetical protein
VEIRANHFGISDRLDELAKNLSEMENARLNGESEVELSKVEFATPLAVLPLAVYGNHHGLSVNCTEDPNCNACRYLRTIQFPGGVTRLPSHIKQYLPITQLPPAEGNQVLSDYEEEILSQADIQSSKYKDTIKFLTSELANNVLEHAKIDHYWILAQYYELPHNRTCEIVIADAGIGYRKSYEDTEFKVATDAEAIQNALLGKSSKSAKKKSNERGQGIPSIARFLRHYSGKLIIMSGTSLMYYKRHTEKKIDLDYWNGSIVCINFDVKDMDILPCL